MDQEKLLFSFIHAEIQTDRVGGTEHYLELLPELEVVSMEILIFQSDGR